MRASARLALSLFLLAGCDQLWGSYRDPNPQNCGTSHAPCKTGLICNPSTGDCEPPDGGVGPLGPPVPVCGAAGFCWENPLPQGNDLYRAFARTGDDVWFAGLGGTLLHWDDVALSSLVTPTTVQLTGVWSSARNDGWAVGDQGTIRKLFTTLCMHTHTSHAAVTRAAIGYVRTAR
jgi:hypothetical protein